jgi:RHS repeat-associated protein
LAITVSNYDAAGDLLTRTMPGGLTWSGTYDSAARLRTAKLQNGAAISREQAFEYYLNGPFVGLLKQSTDGRGVSALSTYDDFLRVNNISVTGPLPEHQVTKVYGYDRRGLLTSAICSSPGGAIPPVEIGRDYDGYGNAIEERVSLNSTLVRQISMHWDAAGRRIFLGAGTQVAVEGMGAGRSFAYGYRADGLMASVTDTAARAYTYDYANSGLLNSRQNAWRTANVTQRDGRGRPLTIATSVAATQPLGESIGWRADSTINGYTATRQGSGAWNESRQYRYDNRGKLTGESFAPSAGVSNELRFGFDFGQPGVGVRTSAVVSPDGAGSWSVPPMQLDALARIQQEARAQTGRNVQATGVALGAESIDLRLDGNPVPGIVYGGLESDGSWSVSLPLGAGSHALVATAHHPSGRYDASATSQFTVSGSVDTLQNAYDGEGYVKQRQFSDGRVQTLTWDGSGRLIKVVQRDGSSNGYDWSAIYDCLGRRLQTSHQPVTGGAAQGQATVLDSWYDPLVEFGEIAVAVNGQRTWKVYGPDLNGRYGNLQGIGGFEATIKESDGQSTGILNDHFGNAVAKVSGTAVSWNATKVGGYGPLPGQTASLLSDSVPLADATVWRGKRLDPTGFYYNGARYYEPQSGRFLSPDPMGHAGGMSLYDYANGDPINYCDPDGRWSKGSVAETKGLHERLVEGFTEVGDNLGFVASAVAGYGEHFEGQSDLYQNMAAFPEQYNANKVQEKLVAEGIFNVADAGTMGTLGLARGICETAETGDPAYVQDRALNMLLINAAILDDPVVGNGGRPIVGLEPPNPLTSSPSLETPAAENIVYRELSAADRAALEAGQPLVPKGTGGTILDQVRGQPTGHISASETIEGTARFNGGNGLVAIDVDVATQGGTKFISHSEVLEGVGARPKQIQKVIESGEVMFQGPIPPSAVTPIRR